MSDINANTLTGFARFFFSFLIILPPWKLFFILLTHQLASTHCNKNHPHHFLILTSTTDNIFNKTGNRGLEIYCHGLGSLVLVAVYIGMHNGDGWNYSESSIALWYERTYWCEAFRNSKIHNLVLEQMNVLINSIKVVFECNSRCGYVYVVACLYKSCETYKNDR